MFLPLLTGIGLSASAGLNAWLPLLALALADRIRDGELLGGPFEFLSTIPGFATLLLLVTVELVLDKSPIYQRNDRVQTVLRPAAGALAFMASASETDLNPIVALVLGAAIAAVVHVAKGLFRLRFAPRMRRILVPGFSLGEDIYVSILATTALIAPIGVPFVIAPLVALMVWTFTRPAIHVDPPLPHRPVDTSARDGAATPEIGETAPARDTSARPAVPEPDVISR